MDDLDIISATSWRQVFFRGDHRNIWRKLPTYKCTTNKR